MKKVFFILVCFMVCFGGILSSAQALDVNALFTTLKAELANSGVAGSDINASEQPIKKILGMGTNLADLKNVLLDFISKGFKDKNLGSLVTCVSDLMKDGGAIKTAADFVSQAIKQAGAMGLKGDGLIAKVQGLVSQKKAALGVLDTKSLGSLLGK